MSIITFSSNTQVGHQTDFETLILKDKEREWIKQRKRDRGGEGNGERQRGGKRKREGVRQRSRVNERDRMRETERRRETKGASRSFFLIKKIHH